MSLPSKEQKRLTRMEPKDLSVRRLLAQYSRARARVYPRRRFIAPVNNSSSLRGVANHASSLYIGTARMRRLVKGRERAANTHRGPFDVSSVRNKRSYVRSRRGGWVINAAPTTDDFNNFAFNVSLARQDYPF